MGDPDIRKLTDPYAPKRDNDSYVLTVGCLAHMLTALDTKLKLEWEPDERHELESKRNTLRTALFLPLDGLKRCNVELNTQARQKPGTTGQKTWIGNTYLDDSGRDSPASLNSTGDM